MTIKEINFILILLIVHILNPNNEKLFLYLVKINLNSFRLNIVIGCIFFDIHFKMKVKFFIGNNYKLNMID